MEAKIDVHNSRYLERLSRVDLISLLKQEIEQRLYLEEEVDSLKDFIERTKDEQKL